MRRRARGDAPWALPLQGRQPLGVRHGCCCALLASLRGLRRRGQPLCRRAGADRALARLPWCSGTGTDWRLGHEIALCGRLIKGYGGTNERGKRQPAAHDGAPGRTRPFADAAARAQAIAAARGAALADEAGSALDAMLVRHGAPPRPVREVPIRFVRRPKEGQA